MSDPERQRLSIAGVELEVRPHPTLARSLAAVYPGYWPAVSGAPSFVLTVEPGDAGSAPAAREPRWRADGDRLELEDDGGTASLDFGEGRGRVALRRDALGTFARCAWAVVNQQVERAGGVVLHASALVRHGGAHVFFGPSGIGKSTLRQRLHGAFADDVLVVRPDADGRFHAHSSPPWGRSAASAPVLALYALGRGTELDLLPLRGSEAGRALMREVRYVPAGDGSPARALAAVARLVAASPVYQLSFALLPDLEDRFWRAVAAAVPL